MTVVMAAKWMTMGSAWWFGRAVGAAGLAMASLLWAQSAVAADRLVAGPGGTPMSVATAVARAADGDTIELLEGEYTDSVVIENRKLSVRGRGKVLVNGGGKIGEAKALWTVRGGDVLIENIEFRGARAQDGGGSGVRFDGGRLTVRKSSFYDNEHGLLAVNAESAELTIDGCVFGLAPKVVGGLYHLLNVGRIGRLQVTGSRFQQGYEGHLIKSRARESFLAYNFIHDGVRGGASYEIDFADGGLATVIGNVISQGVESQNPVLVAYGTDGRAWPRNELRLVHNTFINYSWLPAWFLRVFTDRLPAETRIWAVNNLLVGPGLFWLGAPGQFEGNRQVTRGMLRDIATYGFELPPGALWRGSGVDPSSVGGQDLRPKAEFEWPTGTREIKPPPADWTPGAYQR
jgi:hypothetical protein